MRKARVSIVGWSRFEFSWPSQKTEYARVRDGLSRLLAQRPSHLDHFLRLLGGGADGASLLSPPRFDREEANEVVLEQLKRSGSKPTCILPLWCYTARPSPFGVRLAAWLSGVGGVIFASLHPLIAPVGNLMGWLCSTLAQKTRLAASWAGRFSARLLSSPSSPSWRQPAMPPARLAIPLRL